MIKRLSRRGALSGGALGVFGLLPGCFGWEYPRNRELGFSEVSLTKKMDSEIAVEIEPLKSATGADNEWNIFNSVQILGYDRHRRLVCRKELGMMGENGADAYETVTLLCEGFPAMLTYNAKEGPCDEDTEMKIADYRGTREGEAYWVARRTRRCDEGLPPSRPDGGWPDEPGTT